MAEIRATVDTNLEEVLERLGAVASRHVPFATALAMTRAAKDAKEAAQGRLSKVFDLRSKGLARTFRSTRGEKRDWPRVTATVYTTADSMVLQETGGTKRPRGRNLAIRTRAVKRTASGKVPQRLQPARVLKRKDVFEEDGAIRQRPKRGRNLSVLYWLRPHGRITPVLGFDEAVQDMMRAKLHPRFVQAMRFALRTAR